MFVLGVKYYVLRGLYSVRRRPIGVVRHVPPQLSTGHLDSLVSLLKLNNIIAKSRIL